MYATPDTDPTDVGQGFGFLEIGAMAWASQEYGRGWCLGFLIMAAMAAGGWELGRTGLREVLTLFWAFNVFLLKH